MKFQSLIFCSLIALISCVPDKKKPEPPPVKNEMSTGVVLTADEVRVSGIQLGKPEQRNISGGIRANGQLDVPPQNLVSVSAALGGFVKHTALLQGMKIKRGQVLATLEGQEFIQLQQEYLSAAGQLEFARSEYDRQQSLAKDNVNAVKTLELSRAAFLTARAKAEGTESMLKLIHVDPAALLNGNILPDLNIISPISGYVTQVYVNIGMHVNPTDVMFRIVDTEHLHAEAQVFEKDIPRLRLGQKVRVTLTNDPHERIAGVYLIGKEITADRTVRVHCHFDNEDPQLIPGLSFTAIIETGNQAVPALPDDAIVTYGGKKYIFTTSDSIHFDLLEIRIGESDGGYTRIMLLTTLPSDRKVVVQGAFELLSRMKNSDL